MLKFGNPVLTTEDHLRVGKVLASGVLTKGPMNADFEAAWEEHVLKGKGHATCTSSCMGALHLAAIMGNLGPGDEVICPAMTFPATVNAVEITGATPVFIDSELTTGNMSIEGIKAAITPKTKAIFLVHFAGIPMNMRAVMEIAEMHDLLVVEDCALALGATVEGRSVGLWGDAGCFSFHPVKHITTGEGGMFVSHDLMAVKDAAIVKSFGMTGRRDLAGPGLNYRMSEVAAALGIGQVGRLSDILAKRANNFKVLKGEIDKLNLHVLDTTDDALKSAHYCLVAIVGEQQMEIQEKLAEMNIETSVYYPCPINLMDYYYRKYGFVKMSNAETIAYESIAFPVGQHLNEEDMRTIGNAMQRILMPEWKRKAGKAVAQ